MNSRGAIDHVAEGISLMVVKKKSDAAVLKIVIDPAVEITRLAAVLGHHENASHFVAERGSKSPARIIVVQDGVDLTRQVHQRISSADMGRAQHVTLKGFDPSPAPAATSSCFPPGP